MRCVSELLSRLGEIKTRDGTHKLSLQLALAAMACLALQHAPRAVAGAHVQVIVRRDALAQVGRSYPEVGKGRLGARAGRSAPAVLGFIFTFHVILQTPQFSWRWGGTQRTNDAIRTQSARVQEKKRETYFLNT